MRDGPAEGRLSGMSGTTTPARQRTFFGQPFELSTPFAVELWERFSFYGMQGIVLIYMYYTLSQGGLGIDKGVATGIMAPTAARCTCSRSSARGSPTGCSARTGRSSAARSS